MNLLFAILVSVTLAWTAPTSGPTPSGYKLYVGSTSGTYGTGIDLGNVNKVTRMEDLTTSKFYTVTSYNSFGESPKSNETEAGVPLAPSSLGAKSP